MYNIGETEKITGISKDRLRYYEEKGILKPHKSKENQYREYSDQDIIEVLSVEYYRSMDLGMSEIKQIRENGDLEVLNELLTNKSHKVEKELDELHRIQNALQESIQSCEHIKVHLNTFSIQKMPYQHVLGEISDSKAFLEYEKIQKHKKDKTPIIKSMLRKIKFSDVGIAENKLFIVKTSDEPFKKETTKKTDTILSYDKCLYTIVEEKVEGKDILAEVYQKSMQWMSTHHLIHQNMVFIKVLLMTYPEGSGKSYLEVFIPLE